MKNRGNGFAVAIVFVLLGMKNASAQQGPSSEIPLQRCDRLPVVVIEVDKVEMHFLVDTAATSMLNLKSFSTGRSKQVQIASWNGTKSASGREVFLSEIRLGNRRLIDVKLPAIDLSGIAKACGGPLDGFEKKRGASRADAAERRRGGAHPRHGEGDAGLRGGV
jgi:hypothetical protein